MPYFSKKHILFIHIPKTGGTTIEQTLRNGDNMSLIGSHGNSLFPDPELRKVALQHQTYNAIYEHRELCKVPFDDKLRVFAVVRNPYHRLMSDLFYFHLVGRGSRPENIYKVILNYIDQDKYDNHNLPQYKFVTDKNGKLHQNITIMRTETLDDDLEKFGYKIGRRSNVGSVKKDYMEFLNQDSIDLINKVYQKDFELFNYPMVEKKD
jgi:hypothetical protein